MKEELTNTKLRSNSILIDRGIKAPAAPEIVPAICKAQYFELLGLISKLELKNQHLEAVRHNIWYFTDYTFFWTPREFLIEPRNKLKSE